MRFYLGYPVFAGFGFAMLACKMLAQEKVVGWASNPLYPQYGRVVNDPGTQRWALNQPVSNAFIPRGFGKPSPQLGALPEIDRSFAGPSADGAREQTLRTHSKLFENKPLSVVLE